MSQKATKICQYCAAPLPRGFGEVRCEHCREINFLETNTDRVNALLQEASLKRNLHKYSEALRLYEQVLKTNPDSMEALFGRLLTDYGIEVVDENNQKITPTLKRLSDDPITSHKDYIRLMELCSGKQRETYREFASKVEEIRKTASDLAKKQNPCDIFICFKQSAIGGEGKTEDYEIGQELFYIFKQLGLNVFFSPVSLRGLAGQDYEPLIYHALSTAKVMILLGSKLEYINSEWVVNEWTRFLDIVKKDRRKGLIACINKGIDPYMLPEGITGKEGLILGSITFKDDIILSVNNILNSFEGENKSNRKRKGVEVQQFKKVSVLSHVFEKRERKNVAVSMSVPPSEPLQLKQAKNLFDAKNYRQAQRKYKQIVEANDRCADAWIGCAYCASKLSIKMKKVTPDYANQLLLNNASAEYFDKAIECMPDEKMYSFLEQSLEMIKFSKSTECALKLFAWPDEIVGAGLKAELSEYFFNTAINFFNPNSELSYFSPFELFDCSCKAIPPENVDLYIARNLKFADVLREYATRKAKMFFNGAKLYYNAVLAVHEGNIEAKLGLFLCENKCTDYEDPIFIKFIQNASFAKHEVIQIGINQNPEFMEAVINVALTVAKTASIKKALKLFDSAIEYIPEEYDKFYTKAVRDMAFVLISKKAYKFAKKYLTMLLEDDAKDDIAYLGRAMIAAKCDSLVSLVLQPKPLLDLADFDSALNCSEYATDLYLKLYNWQIYLSTSKKVRGESGGLKKKQILELRNNLKVSGLEGTELLTFNDAFFKQAVETGDFGEGRRYGMIMKNQALAAKRAARAKKAHRRSNALTALKVIGGILVFPIVVVGFIIYGIFTASSD